MKKLAVFFPGIGYSADMPLLYYSRKLAAAQGYEIKLLPYGGFPKGVRGDRDRMTACYRTALKQAGEMLADVDLGAYDDILFVGKSIGTILAAWFSMKSPARGRIRLVLYTPLEETFVYPLGAAVAFTGAEDPWVEGGPGAIPALCREHGVPCMELPGANHSLETGDPARDIRALSEIMERTARFIAGEETA